MNDQEIETKLYIRSLPKLERRLQEMRARLIQPRVLEINRRFDLPDRSLKSAGQVLRIRQDAQGRLTYKGRGRSDAGVLSRDELEVTVSDAETAQRILEALGFVQSAVYEKYRRVYELERCHIMLDELPYGDFVEIEGPEESSIRAIAGRLDLRIERAVERSYLGIFEDYCRGRDLDPEALTFEALSGKRPIRTELGLQPADEG
jgi:adenylate cyclase class 2